MLLTKVISGLVVGGLIVASAVLWKYVWLAMVLFLSIAGSHELYTMLRRKGYRVQFLIPVTINVLVLATTFWFADRAGPVGNEGWQALHYKVISMQHMILLFGFLAVSFLALFLKPRATIAEMASSLFQMVYMGWFPSFLILLRFVDHGPYFLIWSLTSVAASDIFGFFAGRHFGKHPFFQHLSPKKTIEGSLGGMAGCMAVALSGSLFLPIPWWHAAILGLALGCVGQAGDLIESLLKRDAEIKDSGSIIPGHGGILDRVDSYVVVGVITYYYLINFVLQ